MFVIERQHEIMQILKTEKSISVSALSKHLFIGEATIRRDLEKLENMNLLKRTYGGAVLLEGLDSEIPLIIRETERKAEKNIIGLIASKIVEDGDVIIMDSSSTTLKMVPYLKTKKHITIITNGGKTAIELGELRCAKVYCTGGMLRENSSSYIGEHARRCIDGYHANKLFFSCRGLSMGNGLTDSNQEEGEIRKIMIKNSDKAILLCDHTKFDITSFCKIGNFENINTIITDKAPKKEWLMFLKEKGLELIFNIND